VKLLAFDQHDSSRNRRQSHGPVIRVAADEPHCGTVPAHDNSVAVMFDFVNPVGADRRLWSFNRLSGDDEPGRKRNDFHCPRRQADAVLVTTNLAWSSASPCNSAAYIPDSTHCGTQNRAALTPSRAPPRRQPTHSKPPVHLQLHPVTLQQPVAPGHAKIFGLSECPELTRLMKDLRSARRRAYGAILTIALDACFGSIGPCLQGTCRPDTDRISPRPVQVWTGPYRQVARQF
jgi:hypothetical protein